MFWSRACWHVARCRRGRRGPRRPAPPGGASAPLFALVEGHPARSHKHFRKGIIGLRRSGRFPYGRTPHIATMMALVVLPAAVHRAEVVPDDQIARAIGNVEDVLRPRRKLDELAQQRAPLLARQP